MQKRLKVVHLDDHRLFQEGVQRCIDPERNKYIIQKFHHSEDALRYIENSLDAKIDIHIIITDFTHPGLNGYYFSKAVREIEKLYKKHTPIMLLTMMGTDGTPLIEEGLHQGFFNAFLPKSAESFEIITAMESLIHK
jgi:DNA-binding NarL/FixJ family response regulator